MFLCIRKIISVTAHIGFHHIDPIFDKTGHEIVLPVVRAIVHEAYDSVTKVCLIKRKPSFVCIMKFYD